MNFPLAPRDAARLLLILSKRTDYKRIHQAADAHLPAMTKLLSRAFDAGKAALSKRSLKKALTAKDRKKVLAAVEKGLAATEKVLKSKFEKLIFDTMVAGGKAGQTNLSHRSLRAAAPAIKGFAFDETNPKAVEWVRAHALETITDMSDTVREEVTDLIEQAFDGDFDVDKLADKIGDVIGDDARAEMIARTETMRASNEGQKELWDQATEAGLLTGNEKQEWIVTPDDRLCPICEPMDGEQIGMDEEFDVDGDKIDGPPAHPNCRCTVALAVET